MTIIRRIEIPIKVGNAIDVAMAYARRALAGDSNDDEHDALLALVASLEELDLNAEANAKATSEQTQQQRIDAATIGAMRHNYVRKLEAHAEPLAEALRDIAADACEANNKRNSAEWDFRCTHIEAAAKQALAAWEGAMSDTPQPQPMDERVNKALTKAIVSEWKGDRSSKVVHKRDTPQHSPKPQRVTPKSVTHEYVRKLEAQAERLAEALRDIVYGSDPKPRAREALTEWDHYVMTQTQMEGAQK